VAHERAVNNGGDAPGIMDLLKAAPSAAVDTLLMRGGLSGILSGSLPKAVIREGIAQAGMPAADYAGETVGTDKPFEPAEALDRAAAGVVTGIPLGASAHLGVRGIRALRENYAARGVDTANIGDDALVEGSLNGSIHPDVGPDAVDTILKTYGSSSEHFSTPERAAVAAERARAKMPDVAGPLERELAAVEDTESHGDPNAVSSKGARGSMQTMPGTLRDPGFGVRPAANDSPEEMRRVGRDYYAALRDHYGSAAKAFAAYNAGPGALDGAMHKYGDDWLAHMPEETRNYVRTNIDKIGGGETVYRAPPPTDDPFRSESGFERTDRPEEPLSVRDADESRTATGDSSSPFREADRRPRRPAGLLGAPRGDARRRPSQRVGSEPQGKGPGQRRPVRQVRHEQLRPAPAPSGRRRALGDDGRRPHRRRQRQARRLPQRQGRGQVRGEEQAGRRFRAPRVGGEQRARRPDQAARLDVRRTRRPSRGTAGAAGRRTADESQRLIPDWQKAPEAAGPRARVRRLSDSPKLRKPLYGPKKGLLVPMMGI
jgi:hypothetical protein